MKQAFFVAVASLCFAEAALGQDDGTELSLSDILDLAVVTASQQSEPAREAPVPITVITSEMIEMSGAKNLKELLSTFVPGMTDVEDHNELNIAMRGIYASSQQKFLIMLDGHRLNQRAYSEANPDFSISLDKIKQIEIIRGPGSSLYGNVALTAVVNIIPKRGADMNGMGDLRVGMGSYGQSTQRFTYGFQVPDQKRDLFFWGSHYRADGEKVTIKPEDDYSLAGSGGKAIIRGAKNPDSYDFGAIYRSNNWQILYNSQQGQLIEPFSGSGKTGEVYSYGDYRRWLGEGPGLVSRKNHLGIKYEAALGDGFAISVNPYADFNQIAAIFISNPSNKAASRIEWGEQAAGAMIITTKTYGGGNQQNTLLVGAQYDQMRLYDSELLSAQNGEFTTVSDSQVKPDGTANAAYAGRLLEKGQEKIYSGFVQLKHFLSPHMIINTGARHDLKDRHRGKDVEDTSPRLAFVFLPSPDYELKLSYARAFVDAPYWYRYNSFASYKGSQGLHPEHLESVQLYQAFGLMNRRLRPTINFFYNKLRDFVIRNGAATGDDPRYVNAGSLTSAGAETEIFFVEDDYRITSNATYQKSLDSERFGERDGRIYNVPNITANLLFDYRILARTWLNLTAHHVGRQLSPISITYLDANNAVAKAINEPDHEVAAATVFNAGVNFKDIVATGLGFDARVYNVADKKYYQGGSVNYPYPQAGRWTLFTLSYKREY